MGREEGFSSWIRFGEKCLLASRKDGTSLPIGGFESKNGKEKEYNLELHKRCNTILSMLGMLCGGEKVSFGVP